MLPILKTQQCICVITVRILPIGSRDLAYPIFDQDDQPGEQISAKLFDEKSVETNEVLWFVGFSLILWQKFENENVYWREQYGQK